MPSHFLPRLLDYQYPSHKPNYSILDHAIYEQYFNNFIAQLQLNSIDNTACNWYWAQFDKDFPASLATDNKGSVVLSPGDGHQWLVFVHSGVAVYLHLTPYIVVSGECI